jgi:cystathionine beta-lyase family protein involved in aluminum resistance
MLKDYLKKEFNIDEKVYDFCIEAEKNIKDEFLKIDEITELNQYKVLRAMQKHNLSDAHFNGTTGYGYNDLGRDTLEEIYADIFNAESALVRQQIISGTHALTVALAGNLRYGDELLSVVGAPYDTMESVIGAKRKVDGSLTEYGIKYDEVSLNDDGTVNFELLKEKVKSHTKLALIQRSKGYEYRPSLDIDTVAEIIRVIKSINPDTICMVDNCYCEFVSKKEPTDVGADLAVGSLIKNLGGGLAPVGGYIVGKEKYVNNAAYRLTAPGMGKEVGPSLGITQSLIHGLFLAPTVVNSSLKGALFAASIFSKLGYEVMPAVGENRPDIVEAIKLKSADAVLAFCQGIQKGAAVDSYVTPEPWDMPGYDSQVVMAAGAFVQGSSIELSADAPMKEPYIVYLQGGLTWYHAKIGIMIAVNNMYKNGLLTQIK